MKLKEQQRILLIAGLIFLFGGVGILATQYAGGQILGLFAPRDGIQQLREADEYLRQNSEDSKQKALEIFTSVLSHNYSPRINALAKYGLAVALEKRREYQLALDHFRELHSWDIEDRELKDKVEFSLGKLYLFINHEEDGRGFLEPLLARSSDNKMKSRIHQAFGFFYLRQGESKRADANFRVALKYNPENLRAQRGKAAVQKGLDKEWLAFEYYDDYLLGDSRLEPAQRSDVIQNIREDAYQAGIKAWRSDKFESAEHYFKQVLENPADDQLAEKAQYWLAETYQKSGSMQKAYDAFDRVLENTDTSMDQAALIKMGILQFNRQKLKKAAFLFQKAIDDFPAGSYTERAIEWRREIRAQLKEHELMNRINP